MLRTATVLGPRGVSNTTLMGRTSPSSEYTRAWNCVRKGDRRWQSRAPPYRMPNCFPRSLHVRSQQCQPTLPSHSLSAFNCARFCNCRLVVPRSGVTGVLPAAFQTSTVASSGRPNVLRSTCTFSTAGLLNAHVRSVSPWISTRGGVIASTGLSGAPRTCIAGAGTRETRPSALAAIIPPTMESRLIHYQPHSLSSRQQPAPP